jgi:hypothetical protein
MTISAKVRFADREVWFQTVGSLGVDEAQGYCTIEQRQAIEKELEKFGDNQVPQHGKMPIFASAQISSARLARFHDLKSPSRPAI